MTREQALDQARTAVRRAATLADHVEQVAHGNDPNRRDQAQQFAVAGALWADVARAHAAIAAATPVPDAITEPEETPNTETVDA